MPKLLKKITLLSCILIGIIFLAVLFIKFDTGAAAEFTDNILRPLLGNNFVISLEKVFYNTSDKLKQFTYRKDGIGFQFLTDGNSVNLSGGNLNLNTIPVLSGLVKEQNEGVWNNKALAIFPNQEVMAYTFVRPDPTRPYAYVTLIQLDMRSLKLGAVAGQKQPAGPIGKSGPGKIPESIVASNNLVAAFNGGFQYRDGKYGMIVGNTTYLPLEKDFATLIASGSGKLTLIKYEGQLPNEPIEFIRQNCPMLIENGQIAGFDEMNKKLWGRTLATDIYTWRSGLGLTANGNLIYAVGNNLTPQTLAQALKMGGAINAMQLDINPFWVRFNIFDTNGNGSYKTSVLTKGVYNGSKEFLNGYEKDFFYIYKR